MDAKQLYHKPIVYNHNPVYTVFHAAWFHLLYGGKFEYTKEGVKLYELAKQNTAIIIWTYYGMFYHSRQLPYKSLFRTKVIIKEKIDAVRILIFLLCLRIWQSNITSWIIISSEKSFALRTFKYLDTYQQTFLISSGHHTRATYVRCNISCSNFNWYLTETFRYFMYYFSIILKFSSILNCFWLLSIYKGLENEKRKQVVITNYRINLNFYIQF